MSGTYLPLEFLRLDGNTQPRTAINEDVVAEYAEAMKSDAVFPPVIVFFDGVEHWLADGFHRLHAARKLGMANLLAEVRTGTRRDAVLFSVGANTGHGMRRTPNDKRRSVETLLKDEEWVRWSDTEIAGRCCVAVSFVGRIRASLFPEKSESRTYKTKHGTVSNMNTANIGRRVEQREPLAKNEKREAVLAMLEADAMVPTPTIATTVGCSEGFVSEVRNELGMPSVRFIRRKGLDERRERFAAAVTSLDGYVLGLENLGVDDFADDPRAEAWAGQLSKLITSLKNLRGILLEGRKETA